MKKLDKKILLILLFILCLFVVPMLIFTFLVPRFHDKDFTKQVFVTYKTQPNISPGRVCYGNIFSCKETKYFQNGEVDTSVLGDYKIEYTFSYDDKKLEKVQDVFVVDNESPILNIPKEEYYYCPNENVLNLDVTAYDNYDGDITKNISTKISDGKVFFSVSDSSGNTAKEERTGIKKDEEKPKITLNGSEFVYLTLGSDYKEEGAKAFDNCDGDLSSKIIISGNVDINKLGEYKINYQVKDSVNNESNITRTVFVYKKNDESTPSGKSIYLTFDDGPGAYTSALLDTLKKYNVKATFFVTNQNLTNGYDDIIKREYEEGHSIGLHSNTHNYGYIYSSVDNYFTDLYAIQAKVKRITGYTSMLMRFPGGSSNTISKNYDNNSHIMSKLTKAVEARGFKYVDWNVVSGDAGETTKTAMVVSNIINSLGGKQTYVVLQHDIKSFSVDAVESVIQFGLTHGYTFRAYDMSSPTVHHHINN